MRFLASGPRRGAPSLGASTLVALSSLASFTYAASSTPCVIEGSSIGKFDLRELRNRNRKSRTSPPCWALSRACLMWGNTSYIEPQSIADRFILSPQRSKSTTRSVAQRAGHRLTRSSAATSRATRTAARSASTSADQVSPSCGSSRSWRNINAGPWELR